MHLGGEREEEELIFTLWEQHMLYLKSLRESSHLALIGIKWVGEREGELKRGGGRDIVGAPDLL